MFPTWQMIKVYFLYQYGRTWGDSLSFEYPKESESQTFRLQKKTLHQEVGKHFDILNRKFSNSTTNQQQQVIWSRTTDKINALGVAIRHASEVTDKWRNTTSKTKNVLPSLELNWRQQLTTGNCDCIIPGHCQFQRDWMWTWDRCSTNRYTFFLMLRFFISFWFLVF